jgi:hypothetical protein
MKELREQLRKEDEPKKQGALNEQHGHQRLGMQQMMQRQTTFGGGSGRSGNEWIVCLPFAAGRGTELYSIWSGGLSPCHLFLVGFEGDFGIFA